MPDVPFIDVLALSAQRCSVPIRGLLAYATSENFLGRVVDGYHPAAAQLCLLAQQAAAKLCEVQNECVKKGFGLFIYDAYRPLRAVQDFAKWFQAAPTTYERERKLLHYPSIEKGDLFALGYVSGNVSQHCFGRAVDVTLIDLHTHQYVDMGSIFDFFDDLSHHSASEDKIGRKAYQHRRLLCQLMQKNGFLSYEKEYWHYSYCEQEVKMPVDIEIKNFMHP